MAIKLKPQERLDDLQIRGYEIIQNPNKFCFGMDAVLLSGFVKIREEEQVLDLGTGTGILPILLEAKSKGSYFCGLEIQEESADMARRSVLHNDLSSKIEIITGDIKGAGERFGSASFDVITTNPPYMVHAHGLQSEKNTKAIARHEILCDLEDVIRESSKVLKAGGRFYMVHRPFRLADIFEEMTKYKIEPKRMRLVFPYIDKEPNMVLVEGVHGGKRQLNVEPPLIVYEKNGEYTKEVRGFYGK